VIRGPTMAPPPGKATALAHPTRKATANAAPLRSGLARGSLRARFRRRAPAPLSGRGRETVIEVYGTTLACIREIKRGMLVRRLAGFHVVVDVRDRRRCCSFGLTTAARSPLVLKASWKSLTELHAAMASCT
jgi:hypothetical protein